MAQIALTREEMFGLALAALGHAALVWVLVTAKPPAALPAPERVSVTLSDETALVSTSPDPAADPAADQGPELGEPAPAPEPEPVPVPQPKAQPQPQPAKKVTPPRQQPAAQPKTPAVQPNPKTDPRRPPQTAGNSSFNDAFKDGIPGGRKDGKDRTPPGQATGQQRTAWQNSVAARVLGPWQRCPVSGLDVEKLRVVVPFTLGRDRRVVSFGTLRVSGITDANRSQVEPFKACAIKAVRLGAPSATLPDEYYDQWKSRELTFSKGRAQ